MQSTNILIVLCLFATPCTSGASSSLERVREKTVSDEVIMSRFKSLGFKGDQLPQEGVIGVIRDNTDVQGAFCQATCMRNQHWAQECLDRGAKINGTDAAGNAALHYAIRIKRSSSDSLDDIDFLLVNGASVGIPNKAGETPLMVALSGNDGRVIQKCLPRAVHDDINLQNASGMTALMIASRSCHAEDVVPALLKAGARVDIRDNEGKRALDHAITSNENADATICLLLGNIERATNSFSELKAPFYKEVQERRLQELTAIFHKVVDLGRTGIVKFLLDRGFYINLVDEKGRTPLMIAALSYEGGSNMVQLLLSRGALVTVRDNEGRTALECAFRMYREVENPEEKKRFKQKVDLLLSRYIAGNGRMTLERAAQRGNFEDLEIVDLLMKHDSSALSGVALVSAIKRRDVKMVHCMLTYNIGTLLNYADDTGMTILMHAIQVCSTKPEFVEIVGVLLEKGANVHTIDNDYKTALMHALGRASSEVVALLLKCGASVYGKDKKGEGVLVQLVGLELAAQKASNNTEIQELKKKCELVLGKSTSEDRKQAYEQAAKVGAHEIAELIISRDPAIVSYVDRNTHVPFCAIQNGHGKVVQSMLDHGVSFGPAELRLSVSASCANPEFTAIVKRLIGSGVSVSARDSDQRNSLFYLTEVKKEHEEAIEGMVELLIEHLTEDDINTPESRYSKETALMRVLRRCPVAVKPLLKHNARIDMQDAKGNNVLVQALTRTPYDAGMLELLFQHAGQPTVQASLVPAILALTNMHRNTSDKHFDNGFGLADFRKLLVLFKQYGADFDLADAHGETALSQATKGSVLLYYGMKQDLVTYSSHKTRVATFEKKNYDSDFYELLYDALGYAYHKERYEQEVKAQAAKKDELRIKVLEGSALVVGGGLLLALLLNRK